MVAATNIPYATFTRWCDEYPEFRAAMNEAMALAQAHWEELAVNHMVEVPGGPKLNTGLWSRSMSARFPRDYSDRSKVELTGKDGGAIEVDHVHDFSKALLDDLLNTRQSDAKS